MQTNDRVDRIPTDIPEVPPGVATVRQRRVASPPPAQTLPPHAPVG